MRQRFAGSAHRLVLLVLLVGLLGAFVAGCGGGSSTDTPSIVTQPVAVSAPVGTSATFTVAASGKGPLTYQWFRNGVAVSGATGTAYTIPSVAADNTGNYFVRVTNAQGSATSNTVALTIPGVTAPTITLQPVSLTVNNGASASFSVAATGTAPLTYQWYRTGGGAIAGATSASYTIPSTTPTSAGSYYVVVTNAGGSANSNTAILTVNSGTVAPSIVTQPTSQSVGIGARATFSVVAAGDTPLTYQWFKGVDPVAGATGSSFSIPAAAAADAGGYHVVVSNAAGSATSNTVTLTVGATSGGAIVTVN